MTQQNQQQGLERQNRGEMARPEPRRLEDLVSMPVRTPQELAQTVREMEKLAFILSPAIVVSNIAEGYVVNRAVVPISPVVDPKTGRGDDVYYQAAIHKKHKVGEDWIPDEVSLNKNGLIKIMSAAGIDITRSERTDNGKDPYYWAWAAEGTIIDFDGRKRKLPPGNVEIDYRDGAASIGEWTPDKWVESERRADAERVRRKLSAADAWKVKAEPIGGWSAERVMNARRFGLRIAEAEALNRLIRNLGIRQTYTIAELEAKPFLIFRCSPDMSDPDVKRMTLAAHLGATDLLYGGRPASRGELPAGGNVIDIGGEAHAGAQPAATDQSATSSAPDGATDLEDFPEEVAAKSEPARHFTLTRASQKMIAERPHYFFETKEGVTFVTEDQSAARALVAAKKAGKPVPIEGERVELDGGIYFNVLECPPAPPESKLPDPRHL
jgi:hypothetical protein